MASIEFEEIMGEVHVFADFGSTNQIIGFGDATFASVLSQIAGENQVEVQLIHDNIKGTAITGYKIAFDIAEDGQPYGVSNLRLGVDGKDTLIGNYFTFAEGGGLEGALQHASNLRRLASLRGELVD